MKNNLSQGSSGFSRIWSRSRSGISGGIREGFNDFRSELRDATKAKKYSRSGMTQWDQPLLWTTTLLLLVGVVIVLLK